MKKTEKEFNTLNNADETPNRNLHELSDEQLAKVFGRTTVTDGNCGRSVSIYDGRCKFHPVGTKCCNSTCKYY